MHMGEDSARVLGAKPPNRKETLYRTLRKILYNISRKSMNISYCHIKQMVGWQKGHLAHKNPIPLILTGSLPEHVEEDTKRLID